MDVNVIGHSYITYGARWIMGVTSALQPARSNINHCHQFFNSQAVEILRNDGHEKYADIIEFYSKDLDRGVNWADIGWKNITHYFNPDTGKGKLKFANAVDETVWYFNRAARHWREERHSSVRRNYFISFYNTLKADAGANHPPALFCFSYQTHGPALNRRRKQRRQPGRPKRCCTARPCADLTLSARPLSACLYIRSL